MEKQTSPAAVALDDVRLEAPVPRPARNIFCVGKNYFDHAHEFSNSGFDSSAAKGAVPSEPIIFSKVPESVVGPEETVLIDPDVSEAIDYEAELPRLPTGKLYKRLLRDRYWGDGQSRIV